MKRFKELEDSNMSFELVYSKLDILEKQLSTADLSQESLQGFTDSILIPLADIAASIGMINKTNILSILDGFSRSEVRDYTDTSIATLSRIENAKLLEFKNVEIVIPTGMKTTFLKASTTLDKIYKDLQIRDTITRMTTRVDNIYKALRGAVSQEDFEKNADIKNVSSVFTGIQKQLITINKLQQTVFTEKTDAPLRVPFAKGYSSVAELKKNRLVLLGLESNYLEIAKIKNVPSNLSSKYDKIQKFINVAEFKLTKAQLQTILETTKTCAKFFELVGGVLNMHMKLDHNTVLNYRTFEKVIM